MGLWSFKKQSVICCFWITLPVWAAPYPQMEAFPEGDRLVYTRLVENFRKGNLQEVANQRRILQKNYPSSVHLDNAYYLTGMLQFQHNQLGEALKSFDVVSTRMVKSGKRPAAMFAKAMTYQKLNLAPQAHRLLTQVMQEYPGSPESRRAWMHLKLEKDSKVK